MIKRRKIGTPVDTAVGPWVRDAEEKLFISGTYTQLSNNSFLVWFGRPVCVCEWDLVSPQGTARRAVHRPLRGLSIFSLWFGILLERHSTIRCWFG